MQGHLVRGNRPAVPSGPWWQQIAASLRLGAAAWQGRRLKPARPSDAYSVQVDPDTYQARVRFTGRLQRKAILDLAERLGEFGPNVRHVHLDIAGAPGLDARSLASLAHLCSTLERDGRQPVLSGVPSKLRLAAVEARIHHLINFG